MLDRQRKDRDPQLCTRHGQLVYKGTFPERPYSNRSGLKQ
jgi:hypothetical protein